jgi:hypothetical protein
MRRFAEAAMKVYAQPACGDHIARKVLASSLTIQDLQ